jgi:hypothetical protein
MATRIDAFQDWRRELEAVEQEMDRLIAAGLPASVEERQVRQTRFVALVERREAAARNLLQSDCASRRDKSPRASSPPDAHSISAAQRGAQALPNGSNKAETGSARPTCALPTDLVQLAPDAEDLPSVSAAVLSADTAARPADVVTLTPDPAGLPAVSVSAAVVSVDVSPGAAELPTDVAAPDVAASVAGAAADIPTATDDSTTHDIVALASDVVEGVPFASSIELPTGTTDSVGSVTNPIEAAKIISSDDPDASLLTLLRRLQSRRSSTT